MNLLDLFLKCLFIFFFLGLFIFAFPILWIESNAKDKFCQDNGFDRYGEYCITYDKEHSSLITEQSDKKVICEYGFYKVFNCEWMKNTIIIQVGSSK